MKKYGLIGFPLGHSFSKGYFSAKFKKENIKDCEYNNYPIKNIESLRDLIIQQSELVGLNVTIPYKEAVIQFLDEIDTDAFEIGAVNTIKIYRSEKNKIKLKGFNTDVFGFEAPLRKELKPFHQKALILGTGGAAKAVAWVLKSLGLDYLYVSRKPKHENTISYKELTDEIIESHKVIINTSPIGMFPNINVKPNINYEVISDKHILYDLIYNPEKTMFLKEGEIKKAITINGLPMLYMQAEKAWEIWNS
jgi:shikimate dehydrogenase